MNVVQGAHSHDFVRAVVELGVLRLAFFCWLLLGMWAGCRRSYAVPATVATVAAVRHAAGRVELQQAER